MNTKILGFCLSVVTQTVTPCFSAYFKFTSSVHSYSTRQSCSRNLYVAGPSQSATQCGLRSLKLTGPRLWNSLPTSVTNSNFLRMFRKTLKDSLLHCYFIKLSTLVHEEILFIKKQIANSVCNCILLQGSSTSSAFAIWMNSTRSLFYCCIFFLLFLSCTVIRWLCKFNLYVL